MPARISRLALALAVALAPATAWAAFHNHLVKSAPLTGETVASPKAITLWFAEKPELAASSIALEGAGAAAVPIGKVAVAAGETNALTASIDKPLAAGSYTVQWKTAGTDGHVIRGKFPFTVK